MQTNIKLNTILYGPPGTGKTYHTALYAVAAIERKNLELVSQEDQDEVLKRYRKYREEGFIEFITFHQSYGYEDFIEGIKPEVRSDGGEISYKVQPGVFKKFCERASEKRVDFDTAWSSLAEAAKENHGHYGFTRRSGSVLNMNYLEAEEAFVITWSGNTNSKVKKEKVLEQWKNTNYSQREEYARGGRRWMFDANQAVIDELVWKFRLAERDTVLQEGVHPYVFIIDEINRGNISRIFGELITLIEPKKRIGQPEEIQVRLPYSQQLFGVPANVYLVGTMNTADRSITAIDTALRRRFDFQEMLPDGAILEGIEIEGLSVEKMLRRINKRIEILYDREHTLGHACFLPLRENPSMEALAAVFRNHILPLLQEYFYEDYEKIRMVLGDNQKSDPAEQFIIAREENWEELFGNAEREEEELYSYEINEIAFGKKEAYRFLVS